MGGSVGVYFNPKGGAEACARFSNIVFAFLLLIVAFSPAKLLAFYENDDLKLAVGDWILMSWCIIASLFVQVCMCKKLIKHLLNPHIFHFLSTLKRFFLS